MVPDRARAGGRGEVVMARRTVVVLPGDGIGPTVVREAIRVVEAAGFEADWIEAEIGWSCWVRDGDPLPSRTVELLERHRVGLLGAITSRPRAEALAALPEHLRAARPRYFSPILGLRQRFDLDVCVRPCRTIPGNPLNFIRRGPDGAIDEPVLDIVVFRQNTEDLYVGVEWTDPPHAVREALAGHPRFAPFAGVPGADLAITTRVATREATRRILRAAFEHAADGNRNTVTLCEKSNVLRETSGMFEEVARDVARDFPSVGLHSVNVDAQLMWLTRRPEETGIVVAGNMFGDLLSDAYAGLVGGLGFCASANLGRDVAVFEPSHGSAPRYAALDPPIVNPIAAIEAGAMLAEHVGEPQVASRVRAAVARVVREGRVRTYDMLRVPGGPDSIRQGAASTDSMADAIIAALAP